MSQFFYTAITRQVGDTYEVATEKVGDVTHVYAEHFVDEAEMRKRARQFEAQARMLDVKGDGSYKAYSGMEPVEAFIVRLTEPLTKDEEVPKGSTEEAYNASLAKYTARVDALAAKAGAKTVSVLTAPEVDDSQEARPVPAVALARSAVEVAEQAVIDAQAAVDKHQGRADTLAEEALSRGSKSATPDIKAELRRKADGAQDEAEQAKARLYHAQQELKARQKAVAELEAQEA